MFVPVYCFWKVAGGDLVYSRVSGLGKGVTVSPCRRMRDALCFSFFFFEYAGKMTRKERCL